MWAGWPFWSSFQLICMQVSVHCVTAVTSSCTGEHISSTSILRFDERAFNVSHWPPNSSTNFSSMHKDVDSCLEHAYPVKWTFWTYAIINHQNQFDHSKSVSYTWVLHIQLSPRQMWVLVNLADLSILFCAVFRAAAPWLLLLLLLLLLLETTTLS